MKIKLFGRDLFEANTSRGDMLVASSMGRQKESKYLLDFYTMRDNNNGWGNELIAFTNTASGSTITQIEQEKKTEKEKLTPKDVYKLKLLHKEAFKLNVDPIYIDKQIAEFTDKLAIIKSEEFDMSRGANEVASIITRLENRKKYAEVKDIFDEYPYTFTSRIEEVLKENDYLKMGQVSQFVADMPNEATTAMKKYNTGCKKLCDKQAVFYIIADKKDFEKTQKRRDPILLAQSPFGHFWQICGAWDKEMLLLEDL